MESYTTPSKLAYTRQRDEHVDQILDPRRRRLQPRPAIAIDLTGAPNVVDLTGAPNVVDLTGTPRVIDFATTTDTPRPDPASQARTVPPRIPGDAGEKAQSMVDLEDTITTAATSARSTLPDYVFSPARRAETTEQEEKFRERTIEEFIFFLRSTIVNAPPLLPKGGVSPLDADFPEEFERHRRAAHNTMFRELTHQLAPLCTCCKNNSASNPWFQNLLDVPRIGQIHPALHHVRRLYTGGYRIFETEIERRKINNADGRPFIVHRMVVKERPQFAEPREGWTRVIGEPANTFSLMGQSLVNIVTAAREEMKPSTSLNIHEPMDCLDNAITAKKLNAWRLLCSACKMARDVESLEEILANMGPTTV